MMTGDGNLLEVQGSVRYTLAQPRVYLFEVAEPEKALRNAAESVLREVVAGRRMTDLLTADRGAFGREVLARLQARCYELGPGGLGVRVEGVSLHDLHPPREVVQAYHDVTRAMEKRDREVNLAVADRTRRLREQEARGQETIRQAEAERFERVRMARARQAEFFARRRARAWLAWNEELALLAEAAGELEQGRPASDAAREYRRRRRARLEEQAALTDFRLYWESLAEALAGRPKVLVDADKLPARRSLWLVPFEPAVPPPLPARPRRPAADEP
jgi:regulator of protease activity HflC (stomatin/prohibitin superfamily)